ncbi:MAG TPA: hypothetical protein VK941_11925 [Gillisia sp.]|nr:hypothetical protein [Gillisia sp.]
MRTLSNNYTKYLMYFVFSIFAVGFTSCSNDDDIDDVIIDPDPDPSGSITVNDQTISGNTLIVQSVTVGQDSWLVVRNAGAETEAGIVSQAVRVTEGTHSNVELPLLNTATLTGEEAGDDLVVMLHVDAGTSGTFEYDTATGPDAPIENAAGNPVAETVTVMGPGLWAEDNQVVTENNEVTFSNVNTGANGWIALYGENEDGTINEDVILGSQYIEAGEHENFTVAFTDPDFDYSGYTIYPRLHHEDPVDGEFTFTTDGTEDLPETYRFDTTTGEGSYVWNTSTTGAFTIQ